MTNWYDPWVHSVEPRGLRAYLRANGWKRMEPFGSKGDVYGSRDESVEIVVPKSSGFADYVTRVIQISEILAEAEERERTAVVRDLSLTDVDVIRVRMPSGEADGSVPIDAGLKVVQMAREVVLAAACSASRPQRAYRAGGNKQAMDYLKTVRLGHSERGSYAITILSPVAPSLQADTFPDWDEEPYARQVTRKLAGALVATREAVDLVSGEEGIDVFEDRVGHGVSANLCDAIAELAGGADHVDLGVSWALTRPAPKRGPDTGFSRREADVLREASRLLRQRQERSNETITGYVKALSRDESDHEGRATVKGVVDGKLVSVQVDFAPTDYSRITEAHDNRLDVTLDGDLRRVGQRWRLDNPRNLYVREDEDG